MEGAAPGARRIVLCGLEGLGLRTLEELHRLGEEVVVIAASPSEQFAARAQDLGAQLVHGDYTQESVLKQAGVERANSIVLTHANDLGNLHAALTAQELNPRIRVVLRMFNEELGKRLQALFYDCHAYSSSAIAAPSFVSAALYHDWEQRIYLAGRMLIVHQTPTTAENVVLPLACVDRDGTTTLFPQDQPDAICLVDAGVRPEHIEDAAAVEPRTRRGRLLGRVRRAGTAFGALSGILDRKLAYLLLALVALAILGTVIFYLFAPLDLVQAFYFTVTILTGTSFEQITIPDAPLALKFFGVLVVLLGAVALTLFYTFITDAIVSARLARLLGAAHGHMKGHVVVCGVGSIGYRVVEQIARQGIPVMAAELRENDFIHTVRHLGVPVLIADVRLKETLEELDVAEARCLVAATDDDLANLQAALNARAINPKLRVVLRVFDPDLAERVERAFDIHISRSVSSLAAPTFAAAAVGGQVIATAAVGKRVLIVGRGTIKSGSWAEGKSIDQLQQAIEGRAILLSENGRDTWRPDRLRVLAASQELVVATTRAGFARFVDSIEG
ncbi:MAG TPA: NAD(P)-binding protein [Chloroflexia bacterium]|jgi:Trk K+ transport system NAD-binding subunit